jgi:hypothetical protein
MDKTLNSKYPITEDEFTNRYWTLGQSMEQIARDLNGWGAELRRYALKAGWKIKTKRQAYDDRMKDSVSRVYFYNEQFFDSWSPEMAWVLGLIASDGCIDKRGHFWQLTMADLDCLEQVANLIGYTGKPIKFPKTNCHVLKLGSTVMVRKLLEIGLTPRKSLTIEFPEMPTEMQRHFIRGVFDGDGNINISKPRSNRTDLPVPRVTFATGSYKFATQLQSILKKDLDTNKVSLQIVPECIRDFGDRKSFCHESYKIRMDGYVATKFFTYLYKDVPENQRLNRKFIKYSTWFEQHAKAYSNGQARKAWDAIHNGHN